MVLQPYPAQQPVPTYAAPTPQPVPATQLCVGKKGIKFICNKPAQDSVIKNNAQAEAEAQKTFRDTQEQIARSNAEAQAAVDKANGDHQADHDAEVKKAGAQIEQAQAKLDAAGAAPDTQVSATAVEDAEKKVADARAMNPMFRVAAAWQKIPVQELSLGQFEQVKRWAIIALAGATASTTALVAIISALPERA